MRFYYFSKRQVIIALAVVLSLCCLLGLSLVFWKGVSLASHSQEPIYQGRTGQKVVAITVNVDWGEEYLPEMLKQFQENKARVTFFVTGKWAEKNPELLKTMDKEGHSIQSHGYQHLHFNSLSPQEVVEQLKKSEDVIYKTIGKKPAYFASPYGEKSKQLMNVVSEQNYDFIMWSVDTIDWQRPSPDIIIKRIVNRVHNDAIILMHPTEPTVKALPGMLKYLRDQGYKMVSIEEILNPPTGPSSHE